MCSGASHSRELQTAWGLKDGWRGEITSTQRGKLNGGTTWQEVWSSYREAAEPQDWAETELGEHISNPLSSSLKPPSTTCLWSNPKRSQRTNEPADRVHQVGLPETQQGGEVWRMDVGMAWRLSGADKDAFHGETYKAGKGNREETGGGGWNF